ncbi:MAG: alkaline phosphatase family protein [Bdellovibrionales bacterium]|nr:alkaline phosphatase family protein [Bdellovibrionales bacterium]
MNSLRLKRWTAILAAALLLGTSIFILARRHTASGSHERHWKLYWFVPDGLRAEPDVFTIYKWASEGKLPNIKRMMEQGSYGYSIPVFPSHTPVNFASLFTGVQPARHGVADGPIRIRDYPLKMVPRSGFSSVAKTIDPFWYTLEQAGRVVSLLSIPGSTPPELTSGNVVKGRWGGWGMEFPNIIFHSHEDADFRHQLGWNDKVFQLEKKLTEFVKARAPEGWTAEMQKSFSPAREVDLSNWEAPLFALLTDSSDDGVENYDEAHVSHDKKSWLAHLKTGEWSDWFPIRLSYRVQKNYQDNLPQRLELEQSMAEIGFNTQARVRVVKLGKKDFFRLRVLYDGLNESVVVPPDLNDKLHRAAGPMVDFVDNFPPQLIYFTEDKEAFLDEFEMSFAWHKRAQRYFLNEVPQDVFIQSIYSPNQMLTSRWWMGYLDPRGARYAEISESEREQLREEVLVLYKHIDEMIGAALDARAPDAYVVLSSDHGAVPLNYEVKLNNLFAKKGWLTYVKDAQGVPRVDWVKTKVVFLNMNHIFIRPDNLSGNYRPASGPAYEKLRAEVSKAVRELKDDSGRAPLSALHTREEASTWGLPTDRVGDLIIANASGYGWIEDVTEDLSVFVPSLKSGYKQAILPDQERGLWTPFAIVGPGVRKGHALSRPISHLEQYPTVMKLLGVQAPYSADAQAISEIIEETP